MRDTRGVSQTTPRVSQAAERAGRSLPPARRDRADAASSSSGIDAFRYPSRLSGQATLVVPAERAKQRRRCTMSLSVGGSHIEIEIDDDGEVEIEIEKDDD